MNTAHPRTLGSTCLSRLVTALRRMAAALASADPRYAVGALCGLAGTWLVTGGEQTLVAGYLLWLVSNAALISVWLKQRNAWLLAMQAGYLVSTLRGLALANAVTAAPLFHLLHSQQ